MPIIAVECASCGAKLKIKASTARTPTEIKCPKCSKMIPVPKDGAAPSPSSAPVIAPPSAPEAAPEAASVMAPSPAPEPEPAPVPVIAAPPPPPPPPPAPAPVVAPPPRPATAPIPAPVQPAPAPAPVPVEADASAPRKAAAPIVLSHLGEQHGPLSIPVQCPSCRWTTKVRQELVGKKIRCKQCSAIVLVVSDGTAAAPAASPVAAAPVVPALESTVAVPPVTSSPVPTPAPVAVPAPAPAPAPAAPAVIVETLKPPVPMAVTPAPAAAPKPAAVTSSAIDVLVSEVSQLKIRLIQMETQKAEVERRAALAEKAFQEAAGQHAVEGINTRRRIGELEAQIAELESQVKPLRALLAECKADAQAELQAATQRAAALQQRVSRLG